MLVDNFLYTISAVRSHFSQSINWSGIRYHLKDGKISKVYQHENLEFPHFECDGFEGTQASSCSSHTLVRLWQLQIDRSKDLGPKFTDLGGKNLYGRKGSPPKNIFISSLARSLAQWRQPKKYDI